MILQITIIIFILLKHTKFIINIKFKNKCHVWYYLFIDHISIYIINKQIINDYPTWYTLFSDVIVDKFMCPWNIGQEINGATNTPLQCSRHPEPIPYLFKYRQLLAMHICIDSILEHIVWQPSHRAIHMETRVI